MYRTLNQTIEIIKKVDKNSALTPYFLRWLCKTGQIQVLNAGSKYLINIDSLSDYLKINLTEE